MLSILIRPEVSEASLTLEQSWTHSSIPRNKSIHDTDLHKRQRQGPLLQGAWNVAIITQHNTSPSLPLGNMDPFARVNFFFFLKGGEGKIKNFSWITWHFLWIEVNSLGPETLLWLTSKSKGYWKWDDKWRFCLGPFHNVPGGSHNLLCGFSPFLDIQYEQINSTLSEFSH